MSKPLLQSLSLTLLLAHTVLATEPTSMQHEFPHLANSPFPRQHVDARNSDFVEGVWAPVRYQQAWHVLKDRAYSQPCANGPEGNVYCVSFRDPETHCNFTALDRETGELLWDDRIEGQCLLDEAVAASVPLVDSEGNVYAADSDKIVSFTPTGQLRWINDTPSRLQAQPPTGKNNAPFGLNVLPSGELVTMTAGDGFILVLDRATGELLAEPFDLPAVKQQASDTPPRPAGFLESLGSPRGADFVWAFAMGESDNETDNDISIDTHTGAILITSAAPAPNSKQDGALWSVSLNRETRTLAVDYFVRFPGPGGSATTPAISKDGHYAIIANNDEELVIVDIPACRALPAGSECDHFINYDLGTDLAASTVITPDNRIIAAAGDGVIAIDIQRNAQGGILAEQVWRWNTPGIEFFSRDKKGFIPLAFHTVSGVVTAYENVAIFPSSRIQVRGIDWDGINPLAPVTGDIRTSMVAIDIQTGEEVFKIPDAGEFHTASLAADQKTLITIEFNFVSQLFGERSAPAGVRAWISVDSE